MVLHQKIGEKRPGPQKFTARTTRPGPVHFNFWAGTDRPDLSSLRFTTLTKLITTCNLTSTTKLTTTCKLTTLIHPSPVRTGPLRTAQLGTEKDSPAGLAMPIHLMTVTRKENFENATLMR